MQESHMLLTLIGLPPTQERLMKTKLLTLRHDQTVRWTPSTRIRGEASTLFELRDTLLAALLSAFRKLQVSLSLIQLSSPLACPDSYITPKILRPSRFH